MVQNNIQFTGALNAGYTLKYKYNDVNNQQVTEIADTSYRTTGTPVGTPGRQDFTVTIRPTTGRTLQPS